MDAADKPKPMKWKAPPIFKFDVVPGLSTCAWKIRGLCGHLGRQRDSCVVWRPDGEIAGILCAYCFIIWYADVIEALKEGGRATEEIDAMLPPGAENKDTLDGRADRRRWEREHLDLSAIGKAERAST